MICVQDIYDYLHEIAPFDRQESWDNSGLLVGGAAQQVDTVAVALDITPEAIRLAQRAGAQLFVSHHPVIFHAQKRFFAQEPAYLLARAGMSAICAHTSFDVAQGGVNDVLAGELGLREVEPIPSQEGAPLLRIGLVEPMDAPTLAALVSRRLHAAVRMAAPDLPKTITRVAVCGGAGADLAAQALHAGADAYVTGDASHHEFLDAIQMGLPLLAAGHYETENPAADMLARRLAGRFPGLHIARIPQGNPVEWYRLDE
ncbi:MAG TPA: Nif3-like dinuclear metal center hexameric protein [Candidatus Fimivicinus intestinavium]|nr:Nif3-like dinuclear metal center hexameric protein [Candidatus Fimivicinus intestinavium]